MKQTPAYQPYSRPNQDAYQMSETRSSRITDMPSFYAAVERLEVELRTFKEDVSQISTLHDRMIGSIGDARVQQQLDELVGRTRQNAQRLRDSIKELQATGSDSREGQIRTKRANLLKEQFLQALQDYRQVEQRFKSAQRTQVERQIKLVKPDATNDEIRAALDENPDGRIFQQALLNNNQLTRARDAYQEVQARHDDILRINQTVMELNQLMNDMALMVEQDGNKIDAIEKNTAEVAKDTEKGYEETGKARNWAQKAREKRKMCFWITVIILLIIALILGLWFGFHH